MSIVFLIGMPGVGKSHWGRIWSREYGFDLHELDGLIETKCGMGIPSIIASEGEAGFREIESQVLYGTIAGIRDGDAIVSCGGGTPTIEGNMSLMRSAGCVVYLEALPATILGQLLRSSSVRPLLRELTEESLGALLERRREFYERAHLKIPVITAHAGTFAEILQACINRRS